MFVDVVKNRRWAPTILIRESKWIDGKSKKITLANLTKLPQPVIDGIRILLKGGTAIDSIKHAFTVVENKPHGQVAAVLGIMKQLKIPNLIAPKNSRFRRLVLGMIAARVLMPQSKLATSTMLDKDSHANTLNRELALKRVDQDDLYEAMDQLLEHKTAIECRLAKRHLTEGGMVLYDVTSSYVEGKKNELAAFGFNKDKKRGTEQIVIGLMTDPEGCPVSVEVFPGNTADVKTLSTQVAKIQKTFGLKHMVLVGDRGILKQKQIQEEVMPVGLDWITAMQKSQIRDVVEQKNLQMSLFDDLEEKKAQRKTAVEPSKPSPSAKKKARTKHNEKGEKVMSFASLMTELAGLCRLVIRPKTGAHAENEIFMIETISKTQHKALELLGVKPHEPFMPKK